ncbi:MAG: hypothetical protein V1750_00875 [Acidobacteriota bacterium]
MSERKYRHRGYQDDQPREERKRAPAGPRLDRLDGQPRGRGLGAPTATVFRCRVCGDKQQHSGAVSLEATCTRCGADLRTCSNCVNFDTARPNECRKPVLTRIVNKSKRNSCELYSPNTIQEFNSDRAVATSDPRAAFDALFKKR